MVLILSCSRIHAVHSTFITGAAYPTKIFHTFPLVTHRALSRVETVRSEKIYIYIIKKEEKARDGGIDLSA